jgi:hypothetical protein
MAIWPADIHWTSPGPSAPRVWVAGGADRPSRSVIQGAHFIDEQKRVHIRETEGRERAAYDETAPLPLLVRRHDGGNFTDHLR